MIKEESEMWENAKCKLTLFSSFLVTLFFLFGETLPQLGDLLHYLGDFDTRVLPHNLVPFLQIMNDCFHILQLTIFPKIT
jgi:hypothetical protein